MCFSEKAFTLFSSYYRTKQLLIHILYVQNFADHSSLRLNKVAQIKTILLLALLCDDNL